MTEGAATPTTQAAPAQTEGVTDSPIAAEDIPYATDEQLDSALDAETGEGATDTDSPGEEAEGADEGEVKTKTVTDSEAGDDQESDEGGKVPKRTVEDLEKELLKKDRENRSQQDFIQRQNQRFGDLKKQVLAEIAGINEAMEEMSPAEQVKAGLKLDKLETKKAEIENEESMFNHRIKAHEIVSKVIPSKDFNVDMMAEVLAEDEACDPEYIARFKKDPFGQTHPHELIMLHKTAKYKYGMRVLATALKKAEAALTESKGSGKKIISKIENVSRNSQGVTGKNAGGKSSSTPLDLSLNDIASLSDEDLNNAYERALQMEA